MAVAPRVSGKGARTYPVWIGNLKETVKESDLHASFSSLCGSLVSCRVMMDDKGKSKGFGYANFRSKDDAESVARIMNGYPLGGCQIKTKGPKVLKMEGHTKEKIRPNSPDYRPFTDCSFFMEGAKCKKGKSCPYRHSELARTSSEMCAKWMNKRCLDKNCIHKHPGGKGTAKDEAVMVEATPSSSFHKCGGRCGDPKCAALFISIEDLTKHIDAIKMPQCRHCRAIFPSSAEYQDHLQVCWARSSTTSTELSSDTPDVEEVLSDTDTEEFLDEGEEPPVVGRGSAPSPTKVKGGVGKKGKEKRKLFNGEKERSTSSSSEQGSVNRYFVAGQYSEGMDASRYHTSALDNSSNSYFSAYSDDDSDSDGDEAVEYTAGEMARLLSLNEQDMLGIGDEGDEEGEEGRGAAEKMVDTQKSSQSSQDEVGVSTSEAGSSRQVTTSTHRIRLEPVGVFWDIENCPVPTEKSAFQVAAKMRREFIEGKREAEFMCVCDITKERREVTDDLNKAQVTLVHITSTAKNAADDKLRQSLRRFAHTYPAPATVVLISGDVNFSMELNDLMHLHDLTVVLVHNSYASDALKVFATRLVNYDEFVKDVKPPAPPQQDMNRIVIVSGLPPHVPPARISSRLDRISDNCGGKVLRVNKDTRTARVLFRTNEWAKKALKRMKGEDVFGHKIDTALEASIAPPPQQQQQQHNMKDLVGGNLAKSFPPVATRQGENLGPRTPPLLHRPGYPLPPPPVHVPLPHPPRGPYGILPPPVNQFPPPPRGSQFPPPPLMPARPPLLMPAQHPPSMLPPAPVSLPRFATPPNGNPKLLPKGSVPRPEGKILIFKIPPFEEPNLHQNIHLLQANAFLSAEVMVLWHSYAEMQVVLRLDFIQTAVIRKEEIIHTLYERGELKAEVSAKFVETCTKSVLDVLRRHNLPWDVTTCGWSSDEEENRIIRSNVIALLRRNPTCWTKFSNFKKRYFEAYSSAISEMTIHNACGGAVQILSDQNSTQSQIIIFYEFSPLVKVLNDSRLHAKLKADFHKLLTMQVEKKIKLLDFVTTFHGARLGPLPTSSSGKMLQEIITSMPDVALIGNKPSNIYVTLSGSVGKAAAEPRASAPHNLAGISAAFCELIKKKGDRDGISYKKFQQEYQSFFHRSFRVSDFLPGENLGVRDLIKACPGVNIVMLSLPGGRKEERVCLDPVASYTDPRAATNTSTTGTTNNSTSGNGNSRPPSRSASESALSGLPWISAAFHKLLQTRGKDGIPLKRFQPEFQTFFHHSFRVSEYLSGNVGVKELIKACSGIQVLTVDLPNGKKEEMVFLSSGVSRKSSSTSSVVGGGGGGKLPSAPSPMGKSVSGTALNLDLAKLSLSPSSSGSELADLKRKKSIEKIASEFQQLVQSSEHQQIPLRKFQQSYQTFFHHSFSVSTYLPGSVGLKDLLAKCQGIRVVTMLTDADGKWEDWVCLDNGSGPATAPAAAEAGGMSPGKLSPDAVFRFRLDCIEVLSSVEGHSLPLKQFPEQYRKVKNEQFRLSSYQAKKIIHLVQAVPDVVAVSFDGDEKILSLSDIGTKRACEREIEVMIYEQPNHCLTLDRFMVTYEKKYSRKLPHFYGHPKLLKLLEDFPDTLEIRGTGPGRTISLKKMRLFACEMTELLLPCTDPMPISKIRPAYKEKFLKDLIVAEYGHPKLIKLLEEIPDVINIHGVGASRTVALRSLPHYASLFSSSPTTISCPASPASKPAELDLFMDEVVAILLTTHSQKMSLLELTKGYNQAFRPQGPKRDSAELLQAIRKLPNFKVTGSGPTCYVQLVLTATTPRGSLSKADPEGTPNQEKSAPTKNTSHSTHDHDITAGGDADVHGGIPNLVKETAKKKLFEEPPQSSGPSTSGTSPMSPPVELPEEAAKRLSSETRRLLLCHPEHSMTLAELVESFVAMGDPAKPNPQLLYQALMRHGGTTGGKFVISYFPADVGGSLVQLNTTDCQWKVGCDLIQLFVFRPTADLSLPVAGLEALYAEYFSRRLRTAVYAAKDIKWLLKAKHVQKVIEVEGSMCSPSGVTKQLVLANLLSELLFARGDKCHSVDSLPQLYQDHFKAPLPLRTFNVKDLTSLMKLPKVAEAINLVDISGIAKPVLNSSSLFVEQLRHLLTKHDGRIALDQLEAVYTAEFGAPSSPEVQKYLQKKLPHFSFHVVNLASCKWAVWSPTGYPCCPQRWTGEVLTSEPFFSSGRLLPTSVGEASASGTAVAKQDDPLSTSFVDDLVDLSEGGGNSWPDLMKIARAGESTSAAMSPALETGDVFTVTKTRKTEDLIDLTDVDVSIATAKENLVPLEGADVSMSVPSPSDHASTADSAVTDLPEAPFDFLKQHPELIAELSNDCSIPAEDLAVLAEVLTLQKLQELGYHEIPQSSGGVATSSSPPAVPVPSVTKEEVPVLPPGGVDQPVDYLKLGWSPDQVLAELQRQKEGSGGILPPDKMEPFLDYFGEMSSRELERIESQEEGKRKPKKSVAGGRKTRHMAIRFPSQSSAMAASSESPPQECPTYDDVMESIPVERLPVADIDHSSSDSSEGSSAVPLNRSEYVRKFLRGENLSNDVIINPGVLLGEEDNADFVSSDLEKNS